MFQDTTLFFGGEFAAITYIGLFITLHGTNALKCKNPDSNVGWIKRIKNKTKAILLFVGSIFSTKVEPSLHLGFWRRASIFLRLTAYERARSRWDSVTLKGKQHSVVFLHFRAVSLRALRRECEPDPQTKFASCSNRSFIKNKRGQPCGVPFYFYPYTTGFCRSGNIPTTYALKASFQIYGWDMRTRILLLQDKFESEHHNDKIADSQAAICSFMVEVAGLELAASSTRNWRATNCATPRKIICARCFSLGA